MIDRLFFKDKNILNKTFNLTEKDFYKRDHDKIKNMDLTNYNIGSELEKYAKNDTIITLQLYEKINELCHQILNTDMLRMLTAGVMANYGLMINLPDDCTYLDRRRRKVKIKSKLSLCDKKEHELISGSIYINQKMPIKNMQILMTFWCFLIYLECMYILCIPKNTHMIKLIMFLKKA